MRGKRTMEGIYFRVRDVGIVFGSPRLPEIIQRDRSTYTAAMDYVTLQIHTAGGNQQSADLPVQEHLQKSDISLEEHDPSTVEYQRAAGKDVFFTFAGLMHALHNTHSPVATEFRRWVYKYVFTLAYGNPGQKKKMVSTLCKVDKLFLEAFMKLVPNNLSCLYLVDTTMREEGKKVLKFGRSKNVKERFYKHSSVFGQKTKLDTVIFVPSDRLSEAEKRLKSTIRESDRFSLEKQKELIHLDAEGYKAIRAIMQTIADKYNDSMAIQSEVHAREMTDQEHEYKLRIKDLERMIDVLEERIQNAVADEKAEAAALLVKLT
ncbi:hypothetical protein F442_14593 [Phytophthora nicotianae P10297]|uniref:Bro-N domain-containing protein n=1 Tax=Phytophthora nicotianae P10297 TaxID=1317064 RepID=W2YRM0_PHYNI|nr:hypothetical protein F442_14593 [Phytophthora nicotianae P10297]